VLLVLIPALRKRSQVSSARRGQKGRRTEEWTQVGSADSVDDPSGLTTTALLKAMAVKEADYGPTGDMPYNEGWAGTMLGLKARMSSSTNVLEPHVFYGSRAAGQVFVRIGPDERIEGGTTMMSNKHVRQISVLRVWSPPFQVNSDDGRLVTEEGSSLEVEGIVAPLSPNAGTWSDTRITGGPEGIVATRNAIDGLEHSWVYDLWLMDRIARRLSLEPLEARRIGPAWKVPYGLGRSLTPTLHKG
jgi:hypothetical protein